MPCDHIRQIMERVGIGASRTAPARDRRRLCCRVLVQSGWGLSRQISAADQYNVSVQCISAVYQTAAITCWAPSQIMSMAI